MTILPQVTLESIIKNKTLTVYFQPIVSNKHACHFGYEALIRGPSNSPWHSPLALFTHATEQGKLVELELLCRELSIIQFKKLALPGKLFLNASPETLFQPDFRAGQTLKMLNNADLSPDRVVIELTEHSPLENYQTVREALKHYKSMGFEIAMDDLGAGYAGLRMWYELRPDFVKIDRHFMCNIDTDKVKQQFVKSIKNIAKELNCKVIAEGVETRKEFQYIEALGLPFCQGFYIAKPCAFPKRRVDKSIFASAKKQINASHKTINTIAELLQKTPAISELATVEYTAELFKKNPEWESIPVVELTMDGLQKTLGVIRRNCLTQLLFPAFGRELSGKKTISALVDKNVLMLEKSLPIEQASQSINEQVVKQKAMEFIITHQGCYQGIGSIMDLMKVITNLQIINARYANPLTLLPGNVPINKKLDQCLQTEEPFVIAYIDLDNFKPYNDYYGYEKGDKIITGLADILQSIAGQYDFIGHIGGDDFILITANTQWESLCKEVLTQFSEWVRHRYFPEDQMMGGITALDRFGQKQFYSMLSLSIGCVSFPSPSCKSYHDVAVFASHAKSMAKKQRGNSLYITDNQLVEHHLQASSLVANQQPIAVGYT